MKVVFVGPTVPLAETLFPSLRVAPPARQGDLMRAVKEGVTGIGLIDGFFEHTPAVWHKEILFALSEGVRVAGAASMGALRAAECAAFGMQPIGTIAQSYLDGTRLDDADVAQSHAPAELGYLPLSEPLVNVEACLQQLLRTVDISAAEHDLLLRSARALFFKDRTWRRIIDTSGVMQEPGAGILLRRILQMDCNLKRQDALLMLESVAGWPSKRVEKPDAWKIQQMQGFAPVGKS